MTNHKHIYSSIVSRYDCQENSWSFVAKMLNPRSNHGAAVVNDNIYVIGGKNEACSLKSVEMYNPRKDVWVSLSSLPHGN